MTTTIIGTKFPIMESTLSHAIYRITLPLVKILVRKGVSFGEFSQLIKRAYVEAAETSLMASEGKATTSRLAIVTGLTRKDAAQLRKAPETDESTVNKYNRSIRVIRGWLEDTNFGTSDGHPRVLTLSGDASFETLVGRYSGDMPTKAMLDELLRVGVVEKHNENLVSLLRRAYIPVGDEGEKLAILGADVALLIGTIDHNLTAPANEGLFQRKVAYNNLPDECLPEFKLLVNKHGQQFLERLNTFLAKHDQDRTPLSSNSSSSRNHAGVGIYYFEEPLKAKSKEQKQ